MTLFLSISVHLLNLGFAIQNPTICDTFLLNIQMPYLKYVQQIKYVKSNLELCIFLNKVIHNILVFKNMHESYLNENPLVYNKLKNIQDVLILLTDTFYGVSISELSNKKITEESFGFYLNELRCSDFLSFLQKVYPNQFNNIEIWDDLFTGIALNEKLFNSFYNFKSYRL